MGELQVVRLIKSQPWAWDELREACSFEMNWRRRREPGEWPLVYAAFTVSGQVDMQPWHAGTTDELWRECGFDGKPPYKRVWRRFRELERAADAFLGALARVVQHARRHEPRVGAHVYQDGTEQETHAALVHDCRGDDECALRERASRASAGHGYAGSARRPARVTTALVRAERQKLAEEEPPKSICDERLHQPDKVQLVIRGQSVVKRIRQNGCWYATLDVDAGIRAYMGERGARRFWHGYYNQKAIDHYTGGVLFPGVYNASYQEYDLFDDVYDNVCRILGDKPQTVIGDKGYSVASVFKKCTENGTAPVFPWRPGGGDMKRHDKDTHDRHGVPRCKHCGGPANFVRFSAAGGKPRLWVDCMIGATEECAKTQTIACSNDWRLLVPLWRTDPLYHELKQSHQSYEAVHDWWRDRYKVAGDGLANRPKVRGIGAQRLRANCAALIEWLRICAREGWLGSARRNHRDPERKNESYGKRIASRLAGYRAWAGIAQPYGEKAFQLDLGQRTPQSRRPRGAPPGQQTLDLAT
jgi:hypothetical protein